MTVGELRKKIKNLPADMPVYTADHDHGSFETNAKANQANVVDQRCAGPYDEIEDCHLIDKPYLVIRP